MWRMKNLLYAPKSSFWYNKFIMEPLFLNDTINDSMETWIKYFNHADKKIQVLKGIMNIEKKTKLS